MERQYVPAGFKGFKGLVSSLSSVHLSVSPFNAHLQTRWTWRMKPHESDLTYNFHVVGRDHYHMRIGIKFCGNDFDIFPSWSNRVYLRVSHHTYSESPQYQNLHFIYMLSPSDISIVILWYVKLFPLNGVKPFSKFIHYRQFCASFFSFWKRVTPPNSFITGNCVPVSFWGKGKGDPN